MTAVVAEVAGLRAYVSGEPLARTAVVMLHGRNMEAADLAPFGDSLGGGVRYVVPDAPIALAPRGRSWWPIDDESRARRAAAAHGPSERPDLRGPSSTAAGRCDGIDLRDVDQIGRPEARAALAGVCDELARTHAQLVLIGFSQGGMLAMDYVLHGGLRPAAMALLSSTRIAFHDWQPRLAALRGVPILVAHGYGDQELPFSAGVGLRDAAVAGGAEVTWLPFDGAHEIPLVVWRAVRKLVAKI